MHRRIQKMLRTPKSNIHSIDRGGVVNEQRSKEAANCLLASALYWLKTPPTPMQIQHTHFPMRYLSLHYVHMYAEFYMETP